MISLNFHFCIFTVTNSADKHEVVVNLQKQQISGWKNYTVYINFLLSFIHFTFLPQKVLLNSKTLKKSRPLKTVLMSRTLL
jgi:hypothetical protein